MFNQYVVYKVVPNKTRPGKTDKFPVNPQTLEVGNAHDPSIWTTRDHAEQIASLCGEGWGVGFVFTHNDPYFFIDLDNCVDENGQWSEISTNFCQYFTGAYIEISQSGTGLHIIGCYSQLPEHSCKNMPLGLELYSAERFVALTGTSAVGSWDFDCTSLLPAVIDAYFPPKVTVQDAEWSDQADPQWSGPESDDELVRRMLNSKSGASVFGANKASFRDLWENNEVVLGQVYPSLNGHDPYDRSSADAALLAHLAFWTGNNHERMKRLMWQSGLVRDKWEHHKDYMRMSVTGAVNRQESVYQGKTDKPREEYEPIDLSTVMRMEATLVEGNMFMQANQQVEHFKGCVYVRDQHRVLTPDGSLLNSERFRAMYGGYDFSMDSSNEKTTKSAFEAFTESRAVRFPRVANTCFRPEHQPGVIIEEENHTLVNTYVPVNTPSVEGDVGPFMRHLELLYPNEVDREIIISYMAACIQYPGVKFQWCPLIQGTEGNGKTLIVNAVAHAIGHRYTHLPNASDLGGNGAKFNSWLASKLFIGIEEIYVSDRREVTEALKPLITNSRIEIQGKGIDQYTGDNRANFIMCSNHKDALQIKVDGRRYCVLYSKQQSKGELLNDGMNDYYFSDLYGWAKSGGYAHITHFLKHYMIREKYNPAGLCQRAPTTSSTQEAIELSMGSVEHAILEAIDEDRPGFMGGWVSSIALEKLLIHMKAERRVPIHKRKDLMQSLGYDHHPALRKGRVNNPILAEGGKPRLYIKRGHIHGNLQAAAEVSRCYCEAQNYPNMSGVTDNGIQRISH